MIKIKGFECPKSNKIMKKIMLGTSNAWSVVHLDKRTREAAYYIID